MRNTLWLNDTFRKTNISVQRFHCWERKEKKKKKKLQKAKQNKPNACLYGDSAHALFSAIHKLNRFNCLFICQNQPVQRDAIRKACTGIFSTVSVPGAIVLVFPGLSVKHIFFPSTYSLRHSCQLHCHCIFLLYTLVLVEGQFRKVFMGNKEDFWLDDFSIIYYTILAGQMVFCP